MSVPGLKLNTGATIPAIGLGTWKSKPGEVQAAVECAIDVGYRHIDCAFIYQNEQEVGAGIEAKIKQNKVKREDLFIVSKLWSTHHDPKDVRPALMESLANLKLDYLDIYLMHSPIGFVNNGNLWPRDEEGNPICSDVDYVDTWKAMEKLVDEGLVKSIGVSNFNEYQINRILTECKVVPVNNQIELHPYLVQKDLVEMCKKNKITLTAFSPLGSPDRPWDTSNDPVLMKDPKVVKIAERLGKSPAQVLIRFNVQRGINVIPKSVTPSRIKNNFEVLGFELSKDDMTTLLTLEHKFRFCLSKEIKHKYYSFRDNYKE